MTENKKRLARQKQKAWQYRQQQAKKAAASKKGSSIGEKLGELPEHETYKRQKERLTNRIVKCSLPPQRKTQTASSQM